MSSTRMTVKEVCPECQRRELDSAGEEDGRTSSDDRTSSKFDENDLECGEPESEFVAPRVPEGMDPVTGNYIRPAALTGQQWNANVMAATAGGGGAAGSPFYQHNLLVVPTNLSIDAIGYREDKQCQTSAYIKRDWSKRLASTLSNRTRPPDDDDDDETEASGDGTGNCIFGTQIRFTIMLISTLCLSSILSNILAFNFTYICMAGEKPENFSTLERVDKELADWEEEEWDELGYNPNLDYTNAQRSTLFMAVAVGALLAVFPLTLLLNTFGSRLVFGCLGYISGVATLALPAAANAGFYYILAIRVVQGAAFSACLPVMGSITSHWSTLKQNGIFIAILSSFLQIAPIFTMPISGELCISRVGWPAVYYLHGMVSLVLFTVFLLYHRNTPNKHPMVSRVELVKVMFNKGSIYSGPGKNNQKHAKRVPYMSMYTDRHIWAILIASFGNFMGTQLSLQYMPTYINKVLHMPVEKTGTASAISPIIMFFIKLCAGQSSDRIRFIGDEAKLRIYNTLSMGFMGVLFIVLAFLKPHEQPDLCLVVLIASTCILGFNSGGFFKSSQQVSRQHSHFTLANISFLNCVCMLLTPLLNELIAPDNETWQWAIVLWIHGIILTVTNIIFCIFASAKPAPWTLDTFKNKLDRSEHGYGHGQGHKHRIAPAKGGGTEGVGGGNCWGQQRRQEETTKCGNQMPQPQTKQPIVNVIPA